MRASAIRRATEAIAKIDTQRLQGGFPFPSESRLIKPRWGAMKLKYAREPWNWTKRPKHAHAGWVETEGHRAKGGRWIKARGVIPKVNTRIMKGSGKFSQRVRGYVHPDNRVERWYLWKGDRVRLLAGKDEHKFVDPALGAAGGYKIYTISGVDQRRNKVYLEGLVSPKSNQGGIKPSDYDSWSDEDKNKWRSGNEMVRRNRNVQMANVSLLIEEHKTDPSRHIYAGRIKTSAARWSHSQQRWVWQRYASKISGDLSDERFQELREQLDQDVRVGHRLDGVYIPFPEMTKEKVLDPSPAEADLGKVQKSKAPALDPEGVDRLADLPLAASLVPSTMAAPLARERIPSDLYQRSPYNAVDTSEDATMLDHMMPLYLSEELSPRFALHKRQNIWKIRQDNQKTKREEYVDAAVAEWRSMGKDRYLREIADSPVSNLRGVPIRPRSEKEVRNAATLEWLQMEKDRIQETARRLKMGYVWDATTETWVAGPKAERFLEKKANRLAKAASSKERLATMTLSPAKNMVVPEEILKEWRDPLSVEQVAEIKKRAKKDKIKQRSVKMPRSPLVGARSY